MINKISLKDIVDPVIRGKLNRLVLLLKAGGYNIVSQLNQRLFNWIDGNERGEFVLDNYKNVGFYYLVITGRSAASDMKITINYQMKNLFTDEIGFTSFERFKAYPDLRLETQNYYNAGFRWFQEPGEQGTFILPHWDVSLTESFKNYKVMFVKTSNEFEAPEIQKQIINGMPGGVTQVQTTPGGTLPQGETITQTLKTVIDKYPLYLLLGGGLVLYFLFINE